METLYINNNFYANVLDKTYLFCSIVLDNMKIPQIKEPAIKLFEEPYQQRRRSANQKYY